MRQPAPALHIDQDLLDARGACHRLLRLAAIEQAPRAGADHAVGQRAVGALELFHRFEHRLVEPVRVRAGGHVEPLPEQRDLLVVDAEFQQRSGRDGHHAGLRLLGLAASELEQLLPQRLELRLIRLEAPEIGAGVGADGDRLQHFRRIGQREARIEILADTQGIDAAAARVVDIIEHGIAHLHLGIGEPILGLGIGGVEAGGIGQLVVGGGEAVIVGLADLGDDGLGAGGQAVVVDPQQRLVGNQIIFDQRVLLRLAHAGIAGFVGEQALHADAHGLFLVDEIGRPVRLGGVCRQAGRSREQQP